MSTPGAIPVAVIGAGPYGLSLGAHLRARGVGFRMFGRPMGTWRDAMPKGMLLRSEGFASNISDPTGSMTLARFCRDHGREYRDSGLPVPLDTFVEYGLWFQRELVPEVEEVRVSSVGTSGTLFSVHLDTGETVRARRVVVASGTTAYGHVPALLDRLPSDRVSHTSAHRDLAVFRGRDVTVIGGGQSALESAALLHEAGATTRVLVRDDHVRWNPPPDGDAQSVISRLRDPVSDLGSGWTCWIFANGAAIFPRLPANARLRSVDRALGPAGAWWLRDRVEERLPVRMGWRVTEATPHNGGVRLVVQGGGGSEEILTDHVLAGTGYTVDPGRLGFLDSSILARVRGHGGFPLLDRNGQSSLAGLYFLGLAAAHTFGPLCRFVCGTRFNVPRCSRHLAAQVP